MTDFNSGAAFHALHKKGAPLILPNVWDAASTKAVADAGAEAIATSSWAVAGMLGLPDGEVVPLDIVVANLARIRAVTTLPITLDFERGYGETPAELHLSFHRILDAGAAGCNLEDGNRDGSTLRSVTQQAARIEVVRRAVDAKMSGFFINARTDLFLRAPQEEHASQKLLDETVMRARAYRQAGADGLFVPGLKHPSVLKALADTVDMPLNVMAGEEDLTEYVRSGVARISFGPVPFLKAMVALRSFAADRVATGRLASGTTMSSGT